MEAVIACHFQLPPRAAHHPLRQLPVARRPGDQPAL